MPRFEVSLEFPSTGSPVPDLCSVYANPSGERGQYGDASYRGNCSGKLIRDVLVYFDAASCLDPMEGSGTCGDVCQELGIHYDGFDLSNGFDALDPENFSAGGVLYDFVWLHPPYWSMIQYNGDAQCLSQAETLGSFLEKLSVVIKNGLSVMSQRGHLGILIGGLNQRGKHFGLAFETWKMATEVHELELAVPEIVRLQHGNTSSKRKYAHAFIPCVHDTLMIFKRQ